MAQNEESLEERLKSEEGKDNTEKPKKKRWPSFVAAAVLAAAVSMYLIGDYIIGRKETPAPQPKTNIERVVDNTPASEPAQIEKLVDTPSPAGVILLPELEFVYKLNKSKEKITEFRGFPVKYGNGKVMEIFGNRVCYEENRIVELKGNRVLYDKDGKVIEIFGQRVIYEDKGQEDNGEKKKLEYYDRQFDEVKQLMADHDFETASLKYSLLKQAFENEEFTVLDVSSHLNELREYEPKIKSILNKRDAQRSQLEALKKELNRIELNPESEEADEKYKQARLNLEKLLDTVKSEDMFPSLASDIDNCLKATEKDQVKRLFDCRSECRRIEEIFADGEYVRAMYRSEQLLKEVGARKDLEGIVSVLRNEYKKLYKEVGKWNKAAREKIKKAPLNISFTGQAHYNSMGIPHYNEMQPKPIDDYVKTIKELGEYSKIYDDVRKKVEDGEIKSAEFEIKWLISELKKDEKKNKVLLSAVTAYYGAILRPALAQMDKEEKIIKGYYAQLESLASKYNNIRQRVENAGGEPTEKDYKENWHQVYEPLRNLSDNLEKEKFEFLLLDDQTLRKHVSQFKDIVQSWIWPREGPYRAIRGKK